jgi:hypothetical protein
VTALSLKGPEDRRDNLHFGNRLDSEYEIELGIARHLNEVSGAAEKAAKELPERGVTKIQNRDPRLAQSGRAADF